MLKNKLFLLGLSLSCFSQSAFAGLKLQDDSSFLSSKEHYLSKQIPDDPESIADLLEELGVENSTDANESSEQSYVSNAFYKYGQDSDQNSSHLVSRTDRRNATLVLRINKDPGKGLKQNLEVILNGRIVERFIVTTGNPNRWVTLKSGVRKKSSETPSGWFTIHHADIDAWSNTYSSSMPYALFFLEGKNGPNAFAIHAHYDVTGYRGSGGCVRMRNADAAAVWRYVMSVGTANTLINVR